MLVVAVLFEVVRATSRKASDRFTRTGPTEITGVAAFIGFWLPGAAMQELPLGTAHVVWVGIGAVGAVILGIVMFSDGANPLRLSAIAVIALGLAKLKFA